MLKGHLPRVIESLILSHHFRKVTCECNEEDINDDDDDEPNLLFFFFITPKPRVE